MAGLTLGARLEAARSRAFVGRAAEVELFRQALEAADPPFSLLWLHGPGGIWKSTLVRRLAEEAARAGHVPTIVDARSLEANPEGVRAALTGTPGGPGGRLVLMLDTAEALSSLDGWLREDFLPGLPQGSLVVVAGRYPPGPA